MLEIYLPGIILSNGLAIALCLIILFSRCKKIHIFTFDDKIFSLLCVLTMFQAFVEALGYCLDGRVYPFGYSIFLAVNTLNFNLSAIISFVWVLYIDYKLFEDLERIKRMLPFTLTPLLLNFVLSIVNIFVPILFAVNENNSYVRAPLTFFTFLITYMYISYTIFLVLKYQKKVGRYIFMPVLLYLGPIFIGTILQYVLYGLTFIWVCGAFGLTALYINLQNEENYIDYLTGLYNRSYLFSYLNGIWNKNKWVIGMMLDLNAFKSINDTYGHLEGDEALRAVGQILLNSADERCTVARYAGDEFVIIMEASSDYAHALSDKIRENADIYNNTSGKPYKISFSIGICDFEVKSIDDLFIAMDKAMYSDKQNFYTYNGNNRRT